jgi:hypothetical protein
MSGLNEQDVVQRKLKKIEINKKLDGLIEQRIQEGVEIAKRVEATFAMAHKRDIPIGDLISEKIYFSREIIDEPSTTIIVTLYHHRRFFSRVKVFEYVLYEDATPPKYEIKKFVNGTWQKDYKEVERIDKIALEEYLEQKRMNEELKDIREKEKRLKDLGVEISAIII